MTFLPKSIIVALIVLAGITAPPAWAAGDARPVGSEWSFVAYPAWAWEETTLRETRSVPYVSSDRPCEAFLDRYWMIYVGRYPSFARRFSRERGKFILLPELLRLNGDDSTGFMLNCAFQKRVRRVVERYEARTGAPLCTLRLDDPERWPELAAHLAIYRDMVLKRRPAVLREFSGGMTLSDAYRPNRDIRYFIDLASRSVHPRDYESPHLKALSPERARFVQEAFARNDLDAVLDTTAPCVSA